MKKIVCLVFCFLIFFAGTTSITYGATSIRYQYDANGNLLKTSTDRAIPAASNLIENSSFETYTGTSGVADGWGRYVPDGASASFQVVQSTASGGRLAQQVSGAKLPFYAPVLVSQRFPVQAGSPYAVSGQFNVIELTEARVELYVDFYDASNQYLPTIHVIDHRHATAGSYLTLKGTGVVPAQAVAARVYAILRSEGSNGSGSFIVDSMQFHYGDDNNLLANGDFELSGN